MKTPQLITFVALSFLAALSSSCGSKKTPENQSSNQETATDSAIFNDPTKSSAAHNDPPEAIHICTELSDPDFNQKVYENFLAANYLDIQQQGDTTKTIIKSRESLRRAPAAAGMRIFVWPAGSILKVQFLEGDPAVIEKIEQHAVVWEKEANIKFKFGEFADPDITIGFDYTDGSWSYLGVQSKKYRPSMNYGWLYADTDNEEYARVVAHEFGHALGLIHEHQNPDENPIKWNINKTYAYYKRTQGWEKEDVDVNIFQKYETAQLIGSKYDPQSIMVYAIPKALTLDGYSTSSNTALSPVDKAVIRRIYPSKEVALIR